MKDCVSTLQRDWVWTSFWLLLFCVRMCDQECVGLRLTYGHGSLSSLQNQASAVPRSPLL